MDILNFFLTMAVFLLLFNVFIRLQSKRHIVSESRAESSAAAGVEEPERLPHPRPMPTFSPLR